MYDGRETCEQFPGGGIGTGLGFGFGIPVFGTGGGFGIGGIRGGLIPGGGFATGAGSGIGPVLDLESAFDVGFTSAEIAATIRREEEAIRAALSEGRDAVITISTGQQSGLTMVLNLAKGLFEIFDRDGRKVGGGVTPEAAIAAVNAGSLRPLPTAAFAEGAPIPGPAEGGEFGDLLRTILGALGQLTGRGGAPPGLEPVAIGGTVNVPVVRGSTADPTGTLRPVISTQPIRRTNGGFERVPGPAERVFQTQPAPGAPTARGPVAAGVAQDLLRILLQIRAERALKDAQRRQRELIAQQLAAIRRIQMGFGQSGLGLGLQSDRRNGTQSAGIGVGIGGTLLDTLIQVGASLGGNLLDDLIRRVTRDPERREITVPNGNGEVEELLKQLGAGGDAATQCGLFRGSAGVRMSSRPASVVCLRDPVTGEARFFGHLGRPLVFQRDVTMAKNIPKLIRKLGGHTTSHRSKR